MDNKYLIPGAILAGGVILAGAVYFSIAADRPPGDVVTGRGNPSLVRPISTEDHIRGNPAAPVMIIEYSDFDCTYCRSFHSTMNEIIANEGATGNVAWVYRHFPLTELHPEALKKAAAAECAAETGGNEAFWEFADLLYSNQPAETTKLGEYARSAGVPADQFASCYSEPGDELARAVTDRENALTIGAIGTPYSLIIVAGKQPIVMDGAYSYDAIKLLLNQALQDISSSPTSESL